MIYPKRYFTYSEEVIEKVHFVYSNTCELIGHNKNKINPYASYIYEIFSEMSQKCLENPM